jgi:hypothetical protein
MAWCSVKRRDNFTFYLYWSKNEDNIKIDIKETCCYTESGNEPSGSIKGEELLDQMNYP